jgi:2-polyprenyl-6-methoxyphenol hydroxylase-like FAD-dependent oxidoreductase
MLVADLTQEDQLSGATYDTPVLVVGAGPVGAVLALELAHHDVPSILIDRADGPSTHPKMDYLNGRSMELLRRLGLTDAIRARGIDPGYSADFMWSAGFDQPPVHVWRHPSVELMRERFAHVNDGTAPVEVYQRLPGSVLEEVLRAAAHRHPLIDLREGHTFTDLYLRPDGVVATVVDGRREVRYAVEAQFLVACDGARSSVRRCLEIPLDESGPRTRHRSVYFTSSDPALRRYGRAFLTITAAGLTLVSRDENNTWTASVTVAADELLTADPIRVIQAKLGVDFAVDRVLSTTEWDGALAIASTYRHGQAFLAGDAAHLFYPMGAHGANTGIADAVDLGWKLAAAVGGWGGPGLLASYEAERRPAALFHRELCANLLEVRRTFSRLVGANVPPENTAVVLAAEEHKIDNMGVHFGQRLSTSPVIWHEPGPAPPWNWRAITASTRPGGRAPSVRLSDGGELFDRLSAGYTLVDLSGQGTGRPLVKHAEARGVPVDHVAIDDPAVRECWEGRLVLVRPDHFVAWRGDDVPSDWDAVLKRITGRTDHANA